MSGDLPGWLERVRIFWQEKSKLIIEEYQEFLSIPNVATDEENIGRNARWLVRAFDKREVETRLLHIAGAPPAVYGEIKGSEAKLTLAFYAHYDGQPVDVAQWASDPWKPILFDKPRELGGQPLRIDQYDYSLYPEARLYARSASDDKAPIMAMLAALDALKASGIKPAVNLKFLFEGEEEMGSPHLPSLIKANQDLLKADLWILCDGPVHQSRRPIVYFGARGIVGLEITVYGPIRPLHSGHYGHWAPNPAALLANLLASLRDPDGNILIEGFYRDVRPLTGEEKRIIAEAPAIDEDLKKELKIAWSEGFGSIYEKIMLPALNIRGLSSGQVGQAAQNAIPTKAQASLDFRLVPDQRPERVKALVEAHLKKLGFHLVYAEPDEATRLKFPRIIRLEWEEGYPPARLPLNDPLAKAMIITLEKVVGDKLIILPLVGGSIPLYLFSEILHTPALILPIVNHDNNQHGPNENLRLKNLWDGLEIFACLFSQFNDSAVKKRSQ
ncbi:MAG: M20/M25/M40 family metallo-hydrolase [Candidatus Aminicenantes bacterium]|nr:M20/M25/M40 family metallo-hydrolase [Candidatus Aminicenantes bacterium]